MPQGPNEGQVVALQQRLHAVDAVVRTLRDTLSERQLAWQPPEGRWSVSEVLEHLVVAHDSYLTVLGPLVRDPGAPRAGAEPWRPSWMGRLLTRGMESPRRLPSPTGWRIGGTARAAAANAFLERQEALRALIGEAAPLDWRRIRVASPVTTLVRMNLGDAFLVLTVHAERHGRQMERILSHPAFPGLATGAMPVPPVEALQRGQIPAS